MDPSIRRWWRRLDDLPHMLTQVTSWVDGPSLRSSGDDHLHVAPSAVACLDGVVRVVTHRRSIDLFAGQVLIIGAGLWHRHEPVRRGSVWFGLGFQPVFGEVVLADHEREWRGRLPSHPARHQMDSVLDATTDTARLRAFRTLLDQVLSESVEDLLFSNPAMQRMMARLTATLHCGVGVKDLVRVSGLSRAQAYRIFRDGYGMALKDAIEINRLWLAEALLVQGMAIAEVAAAAGWSSADTFSRAWKRHHGTPPSWVKSRTAKTVLEIAEQRPGLTIEPEPCRLAVGQG